MFFHVQLILLFPPFLLQFHDKYINDSISGTSGDIIYNPPQAGITTLTIYPQKLLLKAN